MFVESIKAVEVINPFCFFFCLALLWKLLKLRRCKSPVDENENR